MVLHPNVPSVTCEILRPGIFRCACTVCGARMAEPGSAQAADMFARTHADHERAPAKYHGMGDLIAKATSAVGIKPCAPCKQRQAQLNGLFPRVLRRR